MNSVDNSLSSRLLFALKWSGTSLIIWLAAAVPPFSFWYLAVTLFVIAAWIVVIIREKLIEDLAAQAIPFKISVFFAYILAALAIAALYYISTNWGLLSALTVAIGGIAAYIWNFIQYMIVFKLFIIIGERSVFRQYSSDLRMWFRLNLLGMVVCAALWGFYAYQTLRTPALTGWWFALYSPQYATGIFWIAGGLLLQGFVDGLAITYLSFKGKDYVLDESVQAWQRPRNLGTL
jgi:hypothetical protein